MPSRRSATRCASRSRRFGIDVICIEPGLIRTEFGETAASGVEGAGGGPYADFNAGVARSTRDAYTGPLARLGGATAASRRSASEASL